jgi:hypothetical protein
MGAVKQALIAEADRNAIDNQLAISHDPYDVDRLVDAAKRVCDWHDALGGDMDNVFGHDTVANLRSALAAFPDEPPPLSPVLPPPGVPAKVVNGHVLMTPATCKFTHDSHTICPVCDGGLGVCVNCGSAEIELDRRCSAFDPTPPPGGGQWASEREHAEHLAATTLPARTFTRFRGNPDFGKGL